MPQFEYRSPITFKPEKNCSHSRVASRPRARRKSSTARAGRAAASLAARSKRLSAAKLNMLARARTAARIYILGEGKGSEDIYTTHYLCIVDLETYQSSEVFDESLWRRLVANGDGLPRGGPTTAPLLHHPL